jgi:serine/threonine protein kinase
MRAQPLTLEEVLNVAVQVGGALTAAHANGIVHRDIKPENIILRNDGIAKVLDFGLAKLTGQRSQELVDSEAPTRAGLKTDSGIVMGTATYMSPEQARGHQVDARRHLQSWRGDLRTADGTSAVRRIQHLSNHGGNCE